MYVCSPRWCDYWIDLAGLRVVLEKLVSCFMLYYPPEVFHRRGLLGLNYGLHLTGGEPFLRYDILLRAVEIAKGVGVPGLFVETNCFWCTSREVVYERFRELYNRGLDGVLISVNPFVTEFVPFERIDLAVEVAREVFGEGNVIVFYPIYYHQFKVLGVRGRLRFEDYLSLIGSDYSTYLSPDLVLPMGRAVYRLNYIYERYPAKYFFHENCLYDLTRPWHIHVDCFFNYVPGYCAGLSLGDARRLEDILSGLDLDNYPILRALTKGLGELYRFAVENYGYRERRDGYVSKCHLCLDIRLHIFQKAKDEFRELQPREFYERLLEELGVKGGAGGGI